MRADGSGNAALEFDLVPDDLRAYVRHSVFGTERGRRGLWAGRGVCLAVFSVPFLLGTGPDVPGRTTALALTVWAALAIPAAWLVPSAIWSLAARMAETRELANTRSIGHWVLVAGPDGLGHRHANGSGTVPWRAVLRVDLSGSDVYIYTTPLNAYVVPHSAFSSSEEAESFAETCRSFMRHALHEQRTEQPRT